MLKANIVENKDIFLKKAVMRIRTADPTLTMGVLYQLSYNGKRQGLKKSGEKDSNLRRPMVA